MAKKPTYEELEQRVEGLEQKAFEHKQAEEALRESTRRLEAAYDQSIIYAKELNEEIVQRKQAQDALQKAHNELEHRVEERTAELAKANEELEEQIQERKWAEEALGRYAEDLARSNIELDQFTSIVSHDLETPLRMVRKYMKLLNKQYKGKLDSKADEFIHFAVDGADRISELIADLLKYSRVGTRGKDFEQTDCQAILDQTLHDMRLAIEDSGAKVTYDPLPTVVASDVQLGQLFQNLIGNAIKFRGEESPRVHVSVEQQGEEYVFSVQDNGIGIDPEQAERIFNVFQRLHTTDKYEGTGIGLAVCKKIVERHGGRIWIGSEPGKGSTFYFTIPAAG